MRANRVRLLCLIVEMEVEKDGRKDVLVRYLNEKIVVGLVDKMLLLSASP